MWRDSSSTSPAGAPVLTVRPASTVSSKQQRSLHSYALFVLSASCLSAPLVKGRPSDRCFTAMILSNQSGTSSFGGRIHLKGGENTLAVEAHRQKNVLLTGS